MILLKYVLKSHVWKKKKWQQKRSRSRISIKDAYGSLKTVTQY